MFGYQIMFLASEGEGCCFMWDITRYKLGLRVRFQLSSEKVATFSVTVPVGQIFVTKVWVREYTICTLFHITQSDSIPLEVSKPLKSN